MPQAIRVAQPRRPILKTGHPLAIKMVLAQVFSSPRIWDGVRNLPAAAINGGPKFAVGGSRGAGAMGFGGTYGAGATDRIDTSLTSDSTQRSWYGRVLCTDLGVASRILEKGSNGGAIGGANNGTFVVVRTYSGGTAVYQVTMTSYLGRWVDFLATWDSSSTDPPLAYVNGLPVTLSAQTALSGSYTANTTDPVYVGNRSDNARVWPGLIECAYIWDRILSPAEAMALYINPYQMFASADFALGALPSGDATVVGQTLTATASLVAGSASGSGSSATVSGQTLTATASLVAGSASGTTLGVLSFTLKNNTGTPLASLSGVVVNIYNVSTGALVLRATGQTTNGSGVCTVTSASLTPGTSYAVEHDLTVPGYGRRLPVAAAT